MFAPLITVIICTYNREKLLAQAIESLSRQTFSSELFEIIVVDNGSTDGTAKMVHKLFSTISNIKYVQENQQGLSHARNRGWREALAPFVAYMDDDAIADFHWVENIYNVFNTVCPQPDAVGGKILPWYKDPQPKWFDDSFETRSLGEVERYLNPEKEPMGFSGSNMAFRRETLRHSGGFSTDYGMQGAKIRFGEDSELFVRMCIEKKLLYYDPKIIVYHAVLNRHYEYLYIFKRYYNIGISQHHIDALLATPKTPLKTLWQTALSILHMPYYILASGLDFRLKVAIKVRRLSYLIGYLSVSLPRFDGHLK
jgi:glucosyl-dolichyl phosphate glucuronosyltransferase